MGIEFNAFTWSILSFFLGTGFGHWLAVHRDKRKEFNEIADRIAFGLEMQAGEPSTELGFETSDVSKLRRQMGYFQKRRFDATMRQYVAAVEDVSAIKNSPHDTIVILGSELNNPELVRERASTLLKLLKRR